MSARINDDTFGQRERVMRYAFYLERCHSKDRLVLVKQVGVHFNVSRATAYRIVSSYYAAKGIEPGRSAPVHALECQRKAGAA